ncbi:glutathione-disulfide reductase [Paraburkholderia pallida]|uniref:Glutathione reductase n=1 Tax=Paraburkholderia pallida TaxID=2547399 RepID=A0A4P7D5T7_9BURK|nr:glutathione-disulfide reductase [Paraburkholderia pallida]QBR01952.1 glutathione-disulfide reductase [Paraburkholderia pallida]
MEFDYDLFVIGAGSGGVRLSRRAAAFGARVAVAEEGRIGGTCVVRGCIPKKLLVYASRYRDELEDAAGYGWRFGEARFSWSDFRRAKDQEVARLVSIYANLLAQAGVEVVQGRAVVVDPHTVEVAHRLYTARHIAIATGSTPTLPAIPGIEHALTSNAMFELPELPQHMAIVGGGYIAAEFACILEGLGCRVDMWYRGDQILRGFDDDVRDAVAAQMSARGIGIHVRSDISALERHAGGVALNSREGLLGQYDAVLYATGRIPQTRGLGLEEVGVALDQDGAVEVDAWSASSVPSIHAIGDVTARPQLTPVATRDAGLLALRLFGETSRAADYDYVPTAVFTTPEVATVGMTEAEAKRCYGQPEIFRTSFRPLLHTLSGRSERTFMKLVVDRESQRVVGAHMVGKDAAEIIQGIAIAVGAGVTKAQFDATIGIHPTAAEEFVTMV